MAKWANADKEYNEAVFAGTKSTPKIEELDWKPTQRYAVDDVKTRLYPLVEQADVICVVGSFFGDEGKGKVVDDIARLDSIKIIARTNSGENAGHTVKHGDKKFVFHLAPSGILSDGKVNLVGPEAVMDPISFMNVEVQQLVDAGIEYKDKLFIGNCHIVTPAHKVLDMILSGANASTLKGMSPIHSSKVTKRGIRMDHLFNDPAVCLKRLKRDLETYEAVLKYRNLSAAEVLEMAKGINTEEVQRVPKHVLDFITAKDQAQYLVDLYTEQVVKNPAFPKRTDVSYEIRKCLQNGNKVLLEGPQSYWLSNTNEKFWESSTSADTSAAGLFATGHINTGKYKTLAINIHKAPGSSRVGIGSNPSGFVAQDYFSRQNIDTLNHFGGECKDFQAIQKMYWESVGPNGIVEPRIYKDGANEYGIGVAMAVSSALEHGECGATTKKPRVTGMFDCVLHHEVNQIQGPYLCLSAVDRGDTYDKLGVTIAYVYHNPAGAGASSNGRDFKNGDIIKAGDAIPSDSVLAHCHPIVKLVPGWQGKPIAAGTWKPEHGLPDGVQDLLANVEYFTGADIVAIGNGPSQGDLIYVKRA